MQHHNMIGVLVMHNAICFESRHARCIERALVLPGAKRYHALHHNGLQLLMLNQTSEVQQQRYNIGGTRRLIVGEIHKDGIGAVEIAIHTQRTATAQINILLPPIGHIVGGPPALQHQIPLQLLANGLLELLGQALHARVVLIIQQRTHRAQITRHGIVHRGQRQARQRALKTVQSWLVPAAEHAHHGHPQHGGYGDTTARRSRLVHPALVYEQQLQRVAHGKAYG
ncbi:CG11777 [Drosophila busckii]|uniref:CG11777 n=1 Tax=Drosophila busckii TaxID=30019 RepID=A0A0M4EEU3_DROBS|nr:CG11777 [Drosophila busckii]